MTELRRSPADMLPTQDGMVRCGCSALDLAPHIAPRTTCGCGASLDPGEDFCTLACEEAAQAEDDRDREDAHGVTGTLR
jgi:hypothetical protein